jgi:molecular chaperone GrpE
VSPKASPPPGGDAEDHEVNGPAPPEPEAATEAASSEAQAPGTSDRDDVAGDDGGDTGAADEGDITEAGDGDDGEATAEDGAATAEDESGENGSENGDPADEVLRAAAEALEVDLELLLAERKQYLDAFRRAQADFENYRKQAQKRQEDAVVRSLGSFVDGLLPVLDSCDAALAHGASEVEPVLSALYGALAKEGLERIDPKGSAFDPAEAEAVVHEPGEGGEQVVAEVLRPGYRWRGRVLRPAMVKVTD